MLGKSYQSGIGKILATVKLCLGLESGCAYFISFDEDALAWCLVEEMGNFSSPEVEWNIFDLDESHKEVEIEL